MEIRHRVGVGKLEKSSVGLCDRMMPVKEDGKLYRTVLYGAETWATKGQASKREVNKMRMLMCACGVTKKDKTTRRTCDRVSKSGISGKEDM